MFTLEDYLTSFTGSLIAHAALAVYLFVIMDVREWRILKKLPLLLLSPITATLLAAGLYALFPSHGVFRYCAGSFAILLMCTLWVRWAWRTEFWRAFSAVCMGGVFQVATSCLSQILLLNSELQFTVVMYLVVVPVSIFLLYRLRFGRFVKEGDQTGPAIARCLEAIHACLMDERRDPAEMFSLRTGDETRHIPLADILFFEAAPKAHHIYLHTADSRLDFVGSLNELKENLDGTLKALTELGNEAR